jgi:DNA-binding transcriptional LysR family regulator
MSGTPDLNLLPVFVAVADAASMSGAARKLGMPKSSVSRGIAALEESLDLQLFHRTTRQPSLTSAGTAFYERALAATKAVQEAIGSIPEQEEEPSGLVRITTPVDLALTFLPELIARFAVRYPKVQIDLRVTNRKVDLVAEGFDLALRMGSRLADSSLVARKLAELELHAFAAPSYLARRGTPRTLDELASHDWAVFTAIKPPVTPQSVKVRCDDFMFLREAVRAGIGVGVLPAYVAVEDVTAGRLVRVAPRWSEPGGNLFFVHPATAHLPRKVIAFRDFLREYLVQRPLSFKG